jgi:2-oxoglutarate ferredoxin oxidoreductase subunit alpha
MTSTSGPGISLMSEFIGLGYYAEIPGVFANVQRVGPSTGLPTRTMQGDILCCAYNSHGDTKHPLLLPASPQEAYELMIVAFDLAERFQTPVFHMSDLDLGMNNWLCDPFPFPERPMDRGKVLDAEKLAAIGVGNWGRYKDLDGDGIPYRTLPGLEMDGAAYFTRGTGHDEYARYTESSEVYARNLVRLAKKFATLRNEVPTPELSKASSPSRVGVLAYGTSHWALVESREQLRREHGIEFDYLRIKAFPFSDQVYEFFDAHDRVYVIDQNRDGQMAMLLRNENLALNDKLRSLVFFDGMPLAARAVTESISAHEEA